MIVVDSGVWIDYFCGHSNHATEHLHDILGRQLVTTGDWIFAEVLHHFVGSTGLETIEQVLSAIPILNMGGEDLVKKAHAHSQWLADQGLFLCTARDHILATFCIEHQYTLLTQDQRFQPYCQHLGLKTL
jgi:predicted nucleic acid-binding protein